VPAGLGKEFPRNMLDAWSKVTPILSGTVVPPSWVSNSQFQVASAAQLFATTAPRMNFRIPFLAAVSELNEKWRFLSLYQIFEHGYVSEMYNTLVSGFFLHPEDAVSEATKALKSEVVQFLNLAETRSLDSYFVSLWDAFSAMLKANNSLALAIEKDINKTGRFNADTPDLKKGVIVCYKIRCAIVHAGLSAPIFDSFGDASQFLQAILPSCEQAAMAFLGIQIS
jgi:hypothetical protein